MLFNCTNVSGWNQSLTDCGASRKLKVRLGLSDCHITGAHHSENRDLRTGSVRRRIFARVINELTALESLSQPLRPIRTASTPVVPLPQNGSATKSPGEDNA